MSEQIFNADNILIYWEDDATRTAFTYDGATGAQIDGVAYTPEQNAAADAELAAIAKAAADAALRANAKAIINDLQAEKARVQPVIDLLNSATVTTSQIKDIAKASKRIADAAIDLARLVDGRV